MPERFARLAALALIIVLLLALPLLISLFGSMQANNAARLLTPTAAATELSAVATSAPTLTAPATATETSTTAPTAAPSPTAGCPSPATPEPFWVDPVLSPTNLMTETISVTLGNGREIDITSESGTVQLPGEFAVSKPVEIQIPLLPNSTNHLTVSGKVEYAPECFYTLQTRTDRNGNPLVIVQQTGGGPNPNVTILPPPPSVTPIVQNGGVTPSPAPLATAPIAGMVYLKPFSQVFALNQPTPDTTGTIWLYEGDTTAPLQVLGQQGAFTHLTSQNGALNFWTLNDNLSTTPPTNPVPDTSVNGQTVELVAGTVFACEGGYPTPLLLGACSDFQDVGLATVMQRVTVGSSVLYQLKFNNKYYWVSSNVLKSEPP